VLGGPLPHVVAAKAVALIEANRPEFKTYANRIVENARALASECISKGLSLATGGTDNHLLLIDVRPFGLNGRQAEAAVRACGITLNRNSLPADPSGPWYASGLRIGTPAVTTLGIGTAEMREIGAILDLILKNTTPEILRSGEKAGKPSKVKFVVAAAAQVEAKARVKDLLKRFPVYPELDLAFLRKHFVAS
jgi:glycine hydroxymethyltransferase